MFQSAWMLGINSGVAQSRPKKNGQRREN